MPTYEFRCPKGHNFEEFFLKMSDAKSELPCPTCGEIGARQMSAGGGLLFKGSGFYITDYGKDRVAAGTHNVVYRWVSGPSSGREIAKAVTFSARGHFLVRAVVDNADIVVQQLR